MSEAKFELAPDHHLTRYDTEGKSPIRTGEYWAFARKVNDQSYSKSFWAYKYGSIDAAYIAAKKYRDDILQKSGVKLRTPESNAYLKKYNSKLPDKGKGHGNHQWGFQIRHNGKLHFKYFTDTKYGDREKSLRAAKAYRDQFITENNIDLKDRYKTPIVPGVSKTYSRDKNGDKKWYYRVSWFEGKTRAKRFSITGLEDDKALRLAKAFRMRIDRQLKDGGSTVFITPDKPNISIWRYMDFTKFVYTLDKAALYFAHVDLLGDPYEGSYSRANKWIRKLAYSKANKNKTMEEVLSTMRETRKHIYVNCWHMNEGESAAMWKLYAKTEEAICIQSTFKRLESCLPEYINCGMVNYIDYDKEWVPEDNIFNPFLYKRQSFEHEREIRAIIYSKDTKFDNSINFSVSGMTVPLDLNRLIDSIYVSPESSEWFYELVKSVVSRFNLKKKVLKSSLDTEPMK